MFAPATYRSRRRTLVEHERPDSGLVLLLGNRRSPRNYVDNPHPFRQDGTFLYYFGLDRPDLYGLIDLDAGASTLYGEEATLDDVVWEGEQTALREDAAAVGIDTVDPPSALDAESRRPASRAAPFTSFPRTATGTGSAWRRCWAVPTPNSTTPFRSP
jgi:Aminopeptidase P, N-terminal domain.